MTTGSNWIDATRSYLMSGYSEERNKLSAAYTAGTSTTLTFTYPLGGIRPGARLSIGTNTFYVWSVDGQVATVSAGEDSSTDANASSGTIVKVNPRFTDDEIWKAISSDLSDLSSPSSGLFGIGTIDLTYNPIVNGYDLSSASDLMSIYEVKYLTPGPQMDNPRIHTSQYRLNRNAITTQFPSGISLQMFEPAYPGYNVRIVYRKFFSVPTSITNDVSTSGLLASAYDLPPLGAAIRLMAGREIKRNFTESQGDTRRASEVGAGAIMQSSRNLQILRGQRITAESARLEALYPNFKS